MTTKTNAPGQGRPPASPLGAKTWIGFRLNADLAPRFQNYLDDTPDFSRTSTLNLAVQQFLDIDDLPEDEQMQIECILSLRYPDRYTRCVDFPAPSESEDADAGHDHSD